MRPSNYSEAETRDYFIDLPGFATPDSFERFRAKTRQFLREHENDLVIHKLRMNEPLTATDLQGLERMLAGILVGRVP